MNEVEFDRLMEQAAAGTALLAELDEFFGLDTAEYSPEDRIGTLNRAVYKGTQCGAWLAVDDEGLKVGSIVEGSDVDCETRVLPWSQYLEMDEGRLGEWLAESLQDIEDEADQIWHDWNEAPVD